LNTVGPATENTRRAYSVRTRGMNSRGALATFSFYRPNLSRIGLYLLSEHYRDSGDMTQTKRDLLSILLLYVITLLLDISLDITRSQEWLLFAFYFVARVCRFWRIKDVHIVGRLYRCHTELLLIRIECNT